MAQHHANVKIVAKKVKTGQHAGKYHMVAVRGAVARAARKTHRTKQSISSALQSRKKKKNIAGFHEAGSLPAKRVIRMTTAAMAEHRKVMKEDLKEGRAALKAERAARGEARRQNAAEKRAAKTEKRASKMLQRAQRRVAKGEIQRSNSPEL